MQFLHILNKVVMVVDKTSITETYVPFIYGGVQYNKFGASDASLTMDHPHDG